MTTATGLLDWRWWWCGGVGNTLFPYRHSAGYYVSFPTRGGVHCPQCGMSDPVLLCTRYRRYRVGGGRSRRSRRGGPRGLAMPLQLTMVLCG